MAKTRKAKTDRGKKSRRTESTPKTRKQSDATRMKRLSRELDKATKARETNAQREEQIRQQMLEME